MASVVSGCRYFSSTIVGGSKVKFGDVFYNSWGHGQTNIDFYKVVGITPKSVKIRQLKTITTGDGFMCGDCVPTDDFKSGDVQTKRIMHMEDGELYLRLEYGWTSLWDGKPKRCSWYA